MNTFLQLPAERRRLAFQQVDEVMGLQAFSVEKDFWVCWILRELFALPGIGEHLTFKGGTSLSKAWRLIERFSEDVDLIVDKEALGFGGDAAPDQAPSNKQRKVRLEALSKRWLLAQEYCAGRNRRSAAQAAGVGVHTAGRCYAAFDRVLAGHLRKNLKLGRGWKFAAMRSSRTVTTARVTSEKQRLRWAAEFCMEGLPFDRRLQLLYDLVFSARVERLLRLKPVRHQ
jgi:hypothetical protein